MQTPCGPRLLPHGDSQQSRYGKLTVHGRLFIPMSRLQVSTDVSTVVISYMSGPSASGEVDCIQDIINKEYRKQERTLPSCSDARGGAFRVAERNVIYDPIE